MNILFICSKNKWRSRTAEEIFKNNGTHQIRSAGTENTARIRLNQKLINWADLVFVMEEKHKVRMAGNFDIESIKDQIIVLDIPDQYQFMDEELIDMLKESFNLFLPTPN